MCTLSLTRPLAARSNPPGSSSAPFNLVRWFTGLSLGCIALATGVAGYVGSTYLRNHMLQRDAQVSMEFINSIIRSEKSWSYFVERDSGEAKQALESFFNHIAELPDVVRANVYAADGTVIWSSDRALIGRHFGPNPELERALSGDIAIETGTVGAADKREHISFDQTYAGTQFVESYIPLWDSKRHVILGVVELYKIPHALSRAIREGQILAWSSATLGGLFLFLCLFWIVRRADRVIRQQQQQLIDNETFSVMGEIASAVAHGIRNPLASIRSSAELALGEDLDGARQAANDIVAEADRLDRWVRDLLLYAKPASEPLEAVDLGALVAAVQRTFAGRLVERGIQAITAVPAATPAVRAHGALLEEVINCVLCNAIDAMPDGGTLRIEARATADAMVELRIMDTGHGMAEAASTPFLTTKPHGLGLGLALSRRIISRFGGALELSTAEGQGTVVVVRLPVWVGNHELRDPPHRG